MRDNDWDMLVRSLQRRNCILFVGPDIPSVDKDSSPGSLARLLAERLASELGETAKSTEPLAGIAFRFSQRYSKDDLHWQVEQFYSEHEADESVILRELASLPFYLIVTSSHDSLLQSAFRWHDKTPRVDAYNFRGGTPQNVNMGTVDEPLIYHLYGAPNSQGQLVLTEQDLIDFLVAIVSKNPSLPPSIAAELQKPGKSLLFIGFGIRHWYLRVLLHALRASNADSRSFALEAFDDVTTAAREQTVFFYKTGYKLEIFDDDLPSFAHELRLRFDRAGGNRAMPNHISTFLEGDSPKVFLSYASEDETFVNRVCEGLRYAGITPWMDKNGGLHAGDYFDQTIKAEIGRSDYFLLFQSPALLGKTFSYVNKEIALAMERQHQVRQPSRFLIPVQIGDCELLPELKHIHTERIGDPNDVRDLVSLISRDYQRRGRI